MKDPFIMWVWFLATWFFNLSIFFPGTQINLDTFIYVNFMGFFAYIGLLFYYVDKIKK